jgi:uncharacterized protein YbjT (DUF2867 family)
VHDLLTHAGQRSSLPEHWKPFVGDLNEPATLEPALRSVEHVFLLPGFRDMDGAGVRGADQGVAASLRP